MTQQLNDFAERAEDPLFPELTRDLKIVYNSSSRDASVSFRPSMTPMTA